MTKPTGRPRGRPKTKEYVTLMARVPQDLADQAKRYAGQQRQTMSDVLRDGLQLLMDEDRYRLFMSDKNAVSEIVSDIKEGITSLMADSTAAQPEIASDMNREEREGPGASDIVSDTNIPEHRQHMSDRQSGTAGKASDRHVATRETTVPQLVLPPFDTTKYALGELCTHGHDYHGTGQSLRRLSDRECLECHAARARAYRQRKSQAQPA